jgi:hypothetical protein
MHAFTYNDINKSISNSAPTTAYLFATMGSTMEEICFGSFRWECLSIVKNNFSDNYGLCHSKNTAGQGGIFM